MKKKKSPAKNIEGNIQRKEILWGEGRRSEYLGGEISRVSCRCSRKEKFVEEKKAFYNKMILHETIRKV